MQGLVFALFGFLLKTTEFSVLFSYQSAQWLSLYHSVTVSYNKIYNIALEIKL